MTIAFAKTLASRFWNDQHGFIVSAELMLVSTIAVLSMVVGLSEVAFNINNELEDVGSAFGAIILGMASIGIILSQWDSNWVYAFQGVILVLAVMLNAAIRARASKARGR